MQLAQVRVPKLKTRDRDSCHLHGRSQDGMWKLLDGQVPVVWDIKARHGLTGVEL